MFEAFAAWIDKETAKSQAFVVACILIIVWAVTGPWFYFSDTWQLVINTSTTIITFLMVFLLQNSQARQTSRHYALTEKTELLGEKISNIELDHTQKLDLILTILDRGSSG